MMHEGILLMKCSASYRAKEINMFQAQMCTSYQKFVVQTSDTDYHVLTIFAPFPFHFTT